MRKLFISALSMLAVAMGFTACSSDDDFVSNSDQSRQITVYATTEQPSATRTALGEGDAINGYPVVWSKGDKITINKKVFKLNGDGGSSTGEFTGTAPSKGSYTAYYPSYYNEKVWPTPQTYVAGNIPQGVPMKATAVTVDASKQVTPFSFKNVGGILRLNLKGDAKVKSVRVSATNLKTKKGTLTVITLDCGSGVQLNTTTATPFHIAVPGTDAGTAYSGLTIDITDDAGKVCTRTAKNNITVQRSKITDINLTCMTTNFKSEPVGSTGTKTATINAVSTNVKWVQLWADGPKFAVYNIGATSATEYGSYYTWGGSYANGKGIDWKDDHNTGTVNLTGNADTATKLWGSNWRMPSKDEYSALITNCKSEVVIDPSGTDKILGYKFYGKGEYATNSIFLPAAGCMYNYEEKGEGSGVGNTGYYWSSTFDTTDTGSSTLCIEINGLAVANYEPTTSNSVRAVLNEPK